MQITMNPNSCKNSVSCVFYFSLITSCAKKKASVSDISATHPPLCSRNSCEIETYEKSP